MNGALDTLERIINNDNLATYPFKYCLVGKNKIPYTINNVLARPNRKEDFCSLNDLLLNNNVLNYEGIGISIIESNISAIDIDKCFSKKFDINSADDRAKFALDFFKDKAYVEFSFSGKGLRILFQNQNIENYQNKYYIKNDKVQIEFYQPSNSARYVTLTGITIYNNNFNKLNLSDLLIFLNKYMLRNKIKTDVNINLNLNQGKSIEELLKLIKKYYLKDIEFQNLWFGNAPGSGKNESQLDYHLLILLYNNITQEKEKLRILFEKSPYFSTKDKKHVNKWNYRNYRYFDYIYSKII